MFIKRVDSAVIASIASGILLALAYPRPAFFLCAWVAFIPLLVVGHRRPLRNGFITGSVFFSLILYWVNVVMTTYGGLNWFFSFVAYLLLVAYLALYFAAAFFLVCSLRQKISLPYYLSLPPVWIALEFVRSILFTGFPWALLGYSQSNNLIIAQFADIFGVYGIGFIVIVVNAIIAEWVLEGRAGRTELKLATLGVLLLVASVAGYGYFRLDRLQVDTSGESLRVALVQGNIAQSLKWDPSLQQTTLDTYRKLSLKTKIDHPELIIWPESAVPFYFQEDNLLSRQVRDLARETSAHLLFGSPAYEAEERRFSYFNSAFMLNPAGEISGRSDKIHLVPFGEYVPLKQILFFVDKLVVGIGDFSPGEISPLSFGDKKAGVLVCFEGIFPELAREYVSRGSDLLVNITNDAWFGNTSAPWQHLGMVQMRAIENRIWVARAANTGVSAFISPTGEIAEESGLFVPAVLTRELRSKSDTTYYQQFGFLFPYPFLLITLVLCWRLMKCRRYSEKIAIKRTF